MKHTYLLILVIIFHLFSHHIQAQKPLELSLKDAKKERLLIEDYFEDIEYVFLETTPDCLLAHPTIYITENYIIACNMMKGGYLFNRKDGKFLHEISRMGEGPDEYWWYIISTGGLNEDENIIYANDGIGWKGFDIETSKVKELVSQPQSNPINKGKDYLIANPFKIGENEYIGYTNNATGKTPHILIRFNEKGQVLQEYPNYVFYDKKGIDSPFNPGYFYTYKDQIHFKQITGNDTLYTVTPNGLKPYVIFNTPYSPKYTDETVIIAGEKVKIDIHKNSYSINFIHETEARLFFAFYTIDAKPKDEEGVYVYDKKTGQLYKSANPREAFINNKDDFPDFFPATYNNKHECATFYSIEQIQEYLDKNPGKRKRNKALQQKLDNMLEDDNHIVVIAKIKK